MLGERRRPAVCVVIGMNVKSIWFAAALTASSAFGAFADVIPDGEYTGPGDGSRVTLIVEGATARLRTVGLGSGCSGSGQGPISMAAEDNWKITLDGDAQCVIDVRATDQGYTLAPEYPGDCGYYSGQACGFYANVSK